jgi:DNA-binding NtrC family response regulator
MKKPNVLLVDDEPATQFGFSRFLGNVGYNVSAVGTLADARRSLSTSRYDAILLDMNLPDGNGVEYIREVRDSLPDVAIVMITGGGDIPSAVSAMQQGADHFLTKPVNLPDLDVFLRKSLELERLRWKARTAQRLVANPAAPFLGRSPRMREVSDHVGLAAENEAAVLIGGETGAGKGVVARWIHENSVRNGGPFVEVNCAMLRGELLASELFGHVRGAFTSAVQDRDGLVGVADRGTLFLDEIGDLDLGVQAQLLKVIEEKTYRRVGDTKTRRSDFRLICATHRDLEKAVAAGAFRSDLYFRISVFQLHLPPLRERVEDIPELARVLLAKSGAPSMELSDDVLAALRGYAWPGNVRELSNVLERALILARGGALGVRHLSGIAQFQGAETPAAPTIRNGPGAVTDLQSVERERIVQVLGDMGGDTRAAANVLGISRASLYRRIQKYGIQTRG